LAFTQIPELWKNRRKGDRKKAPEVNYDKVIEVEIDSTETARLPSTCLDGTFTLFTLV
jgi:hypothetical protein